MAIFKRMFTGKRVFTTLLVLAGVAVCARLGIWQLDRLEQRRAFNSRVLAQVDQPEITLTGPALDTDLYNMEYHEVVVQGQYDFEQEIAIRNQVHDNQWGVRLVTPLVISGTQRAVLVDRGWIPAADYQSGDWRRFAEPGTVTVHGVLRRPMSAAEIGSRTDPTPAPGQVNRSWNFVNIDAIGQQVSYPLLPAYVQQSPDPSWTGMPYRSTPEIEITEGPHMGYAIQWFIFASILGMGYPFFVRRQIHREIEA